MSVQNEKNESTGLEGWEYRIRRIRVHDEKNKSSERKEWECRMKRKRKMRVQDERNESTERKEWEIKMRRLRVQDRIMRSSKLYTNDIFERQITYLI